MYDTTDTIAAIATPVGESGIGVIRISGSGAYGVGEKIFHGKGKKESANIRTGPFISARLSIRKVLS